MLLKFKVENFRSIKEECLLDLTIAKKFRDKELDENVSHKSTNAYGIATVKSVVLFGANASGKSNFLKAIHALDTLVLKSAEFKLDQPIYQYEPFKLCVQTSIKPTKFAIDFIAKDGFRYEYQVCFLANRFVYENLYFYPKSNKPRKTAVYERTIGEKTKFGTYYKGNKKFEVYDNQLYLSQVSTRPIASLIEPYRFFSKYLYCSTIHDTRHEESVIRSYTNIIAKDHPFFMPNLNRVLRAADTEIQRLLVEKDDDISLKLPEDIDEITKNTILEEYSHKIKTIHKVFDEDRESDEIIFDLNEESTGTKKLVVVGSLILDALHDGSTIFIDELDKSLHPLLTQMLIKLFNSTKNNPHNAQLIFASHDISLIDRSMFRLDQLFFAAKDYKGASNYFRLSSFTDISRVAPLAKWYLLGRFGATPMIDEYELELDFD